MLIELTDFAFAPNGPVHQVLGQHRPLQMAVAHQFAVLIENNRGIAKPIVALNEQRGGLGKTAAYTIVMLLDISLTGERAVYATFTRALRNSIMEMEAQYDDIMRQTLEANGLSYRSVTIQEVKSPTAVISPTKCEAIRTRLLEGRIPLADTIEVQEFIDCVDASEHPCEFTDLYEIMPALPCGWTELSLALCPQDQQTEDWRVVQQTRQRASEPRSLLLLTHAMMVRNNLRKGRLFTDADGFADAKTMLIDEADKIPAIATQALRFTVSRNEMTDLLREVGQKKVITGLKQLDRLLVHLGTFSNEHAIANQISDTIGSIRDDFLVLRRLETTDILTADRIRLLCENMMMIAEMRTFEHALLLTSKVRDPLERQDIQVTLDLGGSRYLLSRMWRSTTSNFETITMASALMTDMPPFASRYNRFRRDIDLDRTKGDQFIERPPMQPRYGSIHRVFVADRVPELLPTDRNEVNLLRLTSLDGLAAQITTAAMRRASDERTVVLFQSYVAMREVFKRLPEPVQERVVQRNRRHLPTAIAELAERPYGIWMGVEWEGINFVHPESRRTMVHSLIITRLPMAPRDEIRATRIGRAIDHPERGDTIQMFEGVHSCYRKFYHGVLMGIRSEQDMIQELWVLDPRWPVPSYVFQRQPPVITRALGTLFSQFSRVIEPYNVRNWYKVDAAGAIETIVEG